MRGVTMPDWAMARAMGRRGTAHPFADLQGPRTALVVIDLQVGYMDLRGGYVACDAAREAVPAVNAMAQALRQAGGLVVWVQNTHDESCLRTWTVLIAGTLTNVCCDSSARDAMMRDFQTVMLSDACAATSAEEHNAALAAFYATFGDVMDVKFASAQLQPARAAAA